MGKNHLHGSQDSTSWQSCNIVSRQCKMNHKSATARTPSKQLPVQSFSQLTWLWPHLSCHSLQSLFLLYTLATLSSFTPSNRTNLSLFGRLCSRFFLLKNPFLQIFAQLVPSHHSVSAQMSCLRQTFPPLASLQYPTSLLLIYFVSCAYDLALPSTI